MDATSASSSASCRATSSAGCAASEYLNFLRVREWQDVHSQLRRIAGELGMKAGRRRRRTPTRSTGRCWPACSPTSACATGPRRRRGDEYRGARNARFAILPGSALASKPPAWVMAAELVETVRLWARTVARIQPEWAEQLAPHLVTPHVQRAALVGRAGLGHGLRVGHASTGCPS